MKTQEAVKLQRNEHTKGIIAGMSLIALWVALVAK
jgi:hypothetical protein